MKVKKYTLVVVDMQKNWQAANHPETVAAVQREVIAARDLGMHIVFLTIPYMSPLDDEEMPRTHKSIRKLVKGYKHLTEARKSMFSDGANSLLCACKLSVKRVRIVGVNTAGCIWALVNGLIRIRPELKIHIVKDACHSSFGLKPDLSGNSAEWDESMWRFFEALPGLKLLDGKGQKAPMTALPAGQCRV